MNLYQKWNNFAQAKVYKKKERKRRMERKKELGKGMMQGRDKGNGDEAEEKHTTARGDSGESSPENHLGRTHTIKFCLTNGNMYVKDKICRWRCYLLIVEL